MGSIQPPATSEWIQKVAAPLPDFPCGKDPRYVDEFLKAKEEIDKVRDVDYIAVLDASRKLLTQITKDLRIAGYHLIAATYVNGIPGLLEALQAYRLLLENFWVSCHPQSANGRLAALSLLNTPRLLAFAERCETETNTETLNAIHQEILHINTFLVHQLGDEVPRLSALAAWSHKLQQFSQVQKQSQEHEADTELVSSSSISHDTAEKINSEHDLATLTRQIHTYLLRSGDLGRALAFSRAYRWGNLMMPPHENGKTKIPRPRESGWAELQHILSGGKADDALSYCEKLFLEPGYHLVFDLQYHACQQAEAMNRPDLALYIQNALRDLLQRHPHLMDLAFNDGTAFAGEECRLWLQQLQSEAVTQAFSSTAVVNDQDLGDSLEALCQRAGRMAKQKKLSEALNLLRDLPAQTEQQRVRKALHESRLCMIAGKPFLAETILSDVLEKVTTLHIATWEPALAVEVLLQYINALQLLEKIASNEEKPQLHKKLLQLRQTVCRIDVSAAARFG